MAEINFLMSLLYGHSNPLEGLHEGEQVELTKDAPFDTGATPIDPIGAFLAKTERDRLAKIAGLEDAGWETPLTKSTAETDPETLPERSKRRLRKVYDAIDRTFAGHAELGEEAKAIARRTLADTRAGVIFDAA